MQRCKGLSLSERESPPQQQRSAKVERSRALRRALEGARGRYTNAKRRELTLQRSAKAGFYTRKLPYERESVFGVRFWTQ